MSFRVLKKCLRIILLPPYKHFPFIFDNRPMGLNIITNPSAVKRLSYLMWIFLLITDTEYKTKIVILCYLNKLRNFLFSSKIIMINNIIASCSIYYMYYVVVMSFTLQAISACEVLLKWL